MSDSIGQIARNGLAIGFLSKNACPRSVATYAFVVYPDVVEAAIDARVEGLKKSRRGMVGQKAPLASGCHVVEDSTTDARKPCSVRRLAWLAATRGSQGTKGKLRFGQLRAMDFGFHIVRWLGQDIVLLATHTTLCDCSVGHLP